MSDNTANGKSVGDLAQEILDRLVSDPEFRQKLLSNPADTLAATGYEISDEVTGYGHSYGQDVVINTTAASCPPCPMARKSPMPYPPPAPRPEASGGGRTNKGPLQQ